MTAKGWYWAYFVVFVVGCFVGKATSGTVVPTVPKGQDIVSQILVWGTNHLFLLTALACLVLISLIVRRRAVGRNGLIVYFGIGLCAARLISGL
jgi:hypothetical protein